MLKQMPQQCRANIMQLTVFVFLIIVSENFKGIHAAKSNQDSTKISKFNEKYLETSSILYGLMQVANEGNVNSVCHSQLQLLRQSIQQKQLWAIKVLDASAVKTAGFIYGNTFWLGSRELCDATQNPPSFNLLNETSYKAVISAVAPFDIEYRIAYVRINSSWQLKFDLDFDHVLHMGFCVPRSCTANDVRKLTAVYVESELFVESKIYDLEPEVIHVTDLKFSDKFMQSSSFRMMVIVLCFTIIMLLCAAGLSKATLVATKKPHDKQSSQNSSNAKDVKTVASKQILISHLMNLIHCFNIQRNCQSLFHIKSSTASNNSKNDISNGKNGSSNVAPVGDLTAINGLHSICAFTILVIHIMAFMTFAAENKTTIALNIDHIIQVIWFVEIFFSISGFLHTFNFLRNRELCETIRQNNWMQNIKIFLKLLMQRLLRLLPLYYFVLLMSDLLFAYIGEVSLFHKLQHFNGYCGKYMWRHMLFINNFYPWKEACANWSWSLACDVQFSVVSSAMLIMYVKKRKLIKITLSCLLVFNFAITFAAILTTNYILRVDRFLEKMTEVYTNPMIRFLPYMLGCIMADYLMQLLKCGNDYFKGKYYWISSVFIVIYALCKALGASTTPHVSFMTFMCERLFVVFNIFWLLKKNLTAQSNWLLRFLELKIFQHLSRLTYALYLLNPLVIAFFFGLSNASTNVNMISFILFIPGISLFTYLTGVLLTLTIEMPYKNLSSLLFGRRY